MPEIVTERLKIKPDARTANRQAEEVNSQAEKSCAPTAGDSDKVPSQLGDGEHKDTAGPTDTATTPGKRSYYDVFGRIFANVDDLGAF